MTPLSRSRRRASIRCKIDENARAAEEPSLDDHVSRHYEIIRPLTVLAMRLKQRFAGSRMDGGLSTTSPD